MAKKQSNSCKRRYYLEASILSISAMLLMVWESAYVGQPSFADNWFCGPVIVTSVVLAVVSLLCLAAACDS